MTADHVDDDQAEYEFGYNEAHDIYWTWLATNPHLATCKGVRERSVDALEDLACTNMPGSGLHALLLFALSVWSRHEWRCGRFDVQHLNSLDPDGLEWVAAWVRRPEFP